MIARRVILLGVTTLIAVAAFPGTARAQETNRLALLRGHTGVDPEPGSLLASPARLSLRRTLLADALARLSKRSGVQIAFSPSLMPAGHRPGCDCEDLNLAQALDRLLRDTELGYVELGSQVVVVPKVQPERPMPGGVLRGRVRSVVAFPLQGATATLVAAEDPEGERIRGSDRLGFFSFPDLPAGDYLLRVARIGYGSHEERVSVAPGAVLELDVALHAEPLPLAGIQVESDRQRARFQHSAGETAQEMNRAEFRAVPGVAEPDPVRTVAVLPGVTRVSEFGATFNVRGGSADQNLILLDGIPIFNPFHMLGMLSVFNADMVERAELRSGGFPAEYGGRASSVLLVESDLGDGSFGVDAGISLLTSRIAVAGGLMQSVRNGLGLAAVRWRVAGRRSYADILTRPFMREPFPYYLADRQAGFEAWTRRGDRFRISAYAGRDVVRQRDPTPSAYWDPNHPWSEWPPYNNAWIWGNRAVGVSWTRPLSRGGALDIHGSYSRFAGDFELTEFSPPLLSTSIRQYSAGADLERRPWPNLAWKSGLAANFVDYRASSRGEPETLLKSSFTSGIGASAYTQAEWRRGDRWLLEGGLRLGLWGSGHLISVLSPRIAAKRFLGDGRWALRASAGRYVQFLQSVRDETLVLNVDAWVMADRFVAPAISHQFQGGVEALFGAEDEWFASAEAYYRGYDGLAARNWAEDPIDQGDDVLSGTGRAYGLDLVARRTRGRTTGWLSISLLKATRSFPDTGSGLNPAPVIEYPPVFDRRMDMDLVVQRRLPWGIDAGLRWNFGTGLPYTRPLSYRAHPHQIIDLKLDDGSEDLLWMGPRNAERLPVQHRLDISLRKVIERRWGRVTPYLDVLNVYNRRNVAHYQYGYIHGRPSGRGVSLLPFLPTFGVEVSF